MHVSSNKYPVEIKGKDIVLSVSRIFPGEYLLHAEGIHSLRIAQFLQRSEQCLRPVSHRLQLDHPGEIAQGNRRLGG